MGFTIVSKDSPAITQISNTFITHYMPSANGNFVKVYLYLQMACQNPASVSELSVSALADEMECTENDIVRAIHYWQKEGLLLVQEKGEDITGVTLTSFEQPPASSRSPKKTQEADKAEPLPAHSDIGLTSRPDSQPDVPVPDKRNYTPLQAEALVKDVEINQTITAIEKLLGSPVSPSHLQTILYFMCDIGFSPELLITLYETAVKKGKKQPQYIEAIGISWARQGITTPAEAKEEASAFNGRYAVVSRALGITRGLAPAERDIIDSWNEYHFSDSIIEEACKRTVLQTGDTNLNYVARILKDWHDKHVISLEDIKKCDESYQRQKQNRSEKKKPLPHKNQFQNFPQRAYSQGDYNSLERKLLQGQKG